VVLELGWEQPASSSGNSSRNRALVAESKNSDCVQPLLLAVLAVHAPLHGQQHHMSKITAGSTYLPWVVVVGQVLQVGVEGWPPAGSAGSSSSNATSAHEQT
jgi:hypothetical protein